ncbi:tetratricopeptide repeat protein [Runella sp. MFBS21]|uniref:tetratricopeptide repeat protein n=1 Tax=Runella sp. MFBS21 TaxID=3034018 RepID=UPI0023F90839|nr:tetratricopeptide repeat protein [Runella sp. MFBS21]MDF7821821.1 tetratricopeptide repeat protein [Runella sp. MFBS21]
MKPFSFLLFTFWALSHFSLAQTTAEEWFDKGYAATNYKDKIYYYSKAIELDSNYIEAYNNRGIARGIFGNFNESIKDFDKVIRINPNYTIAYNNRGVSKDGYFKFSNAIEDFDQALRINPNYVLAHNNKEIAKKKLKTYKHRRTWVPSANLGINKEIIKCYTEAVGSHSKVIEKPAPQDAFTYYNKGLENYKLGRYHEAIKDYDNAIALNPNDAKAYLNKGSCLVNLNRHCEAMEAFRKGESLDNTLTYHQSDKTTAQQRCGSTSPTPTLSRRYALVISNSGYQHTKSLGSQPATDARKVKTTLEILGFTVVEVNETALKANMEFAIADFIRKAANADMVVSYYAGHGIEMGGVNYLLPLGVRLREPEHAEIEAVRLDFLVGQLAKCKAKINLVLLDACRDDPFADRQAAHRPVDDYRGFKTIESTPGSTLVMYAAEPRHRALNTGVFADAIQQNLRAGVEVMDFVRNLTRTVYQKTNQNQKPTLFGAILDEFKF